MSGIVGFYYIDGRPAKLRSLTQMVDVLAHRGPDGSHIWSEGSLGLGHRMLFTTPESRQEKFPMVSSSENFVLTADARIDNRQDLIHRLGLSPRQTSAYTDGQLILKAYEKWGENTPEFLVGDFSFAIWDRQQQKLFCVRDPLGVRPFYFFKSHRFFAFASEIKGLLSLEEIPCQPNQTQISKYLSGYFLPRGEGESYYQDIWELSPGESLTVDHAGHIQRRTYWKPDLSYELKLSSDEEYVEAFRETFTQAVSRRMRSAFPVGSTLSGGLDSTSIACTAQRLLDEQGSTDRLKTFSAVFPVVAEIDGRIDERSYMQAAKEKSRFDAYDFLADQEGPFEDITKMAFHGEEPIPAPNFYMDWGLFKQAQQQGVRVLMTGIDGDTTVTYGYQYLEELASRFRFLKLYQEAKALSQVEPLGTPKSIMWRFGLQSNLPESYVKAIQKIRNRPVADFNWQVDHTLLKNNFANETGVRDLVMSSFGQAMVGRPSKLSSREVHLLGLQQGSVSLALTWLDKTGGAFGLEARHPFCDRDLVELCIALPSHQKLKQGWTRSILRRAMQDTLPEKVQWRVGKGNLSANFKFKMARHYTSILGNLIHNKNHQIYNYIDQKKMERSYKRLIENPLKRDPEATQIFLALGLHFWLTKNVSRERILSYSE